MVIKLVSTSILASSCVSNRVRASSSVPHDAYSEQPLTTDSNEKIKTIESSFMDAILRLQETDHKRTTDPSPPSCQSR